jgi:hypothetical protein
MKTSAGTLAFSRANNGKETMDKKCQATFTRRSGEVLQCTCERGHNSVHYNGDIWWPNKQGLPNSAERLPWYWRLLKFLVPLNKP